MSESSRTPPALTEVRARLEEIDRTLILLVAARLEAAELAIRIRSLGDGRVSDPAQERRVVARARRWAEEAGLPPALAESIFRAVIDAGKERFASIDHRVLAAADPARTRAMSEGLRAPVSLLESPVPKRSPPIVSTG